MFFHFLLTLLYVYGRDDPMIIIEVLYESRKSAFDIVYLGLALPLEVILLQ